MPDRLYDLTQPLGPMMSVPPGIPKPSFETIRCVGVDRSNVTEYRFCSHVGTHMDAPFHYYADGKHLDEIPLDRFSGDGYVASVHLEPLAALRAADLEPYREQIRGIPFLLLAFGWADRYGSPAYWEHPYIGEDAAKAIVELGVGCVGIDAFTPDVPLALRTNGHRGPIHRILLGGGVLIIENLASLAALEGRRVHVTAFPILISDSDGAPVRVVARA